MVIGKLKVTEVREFSNTQAKKVILTAEYDPKNVPEDRAFNQYSPSATFEMLVNNPPAAAQLPAGATRYILFLTEEEYRAIVPPVVEAPGEAVESPKQ